jgi:predicted DNA-binding transcriptional regulator AlpA
MKPHKFPAHDRAVREPERREITGVPTSTWYELQDAGLAPKPFSLTGSRSVGWSFNELTDWVERRKATRADTRHPLGAAAAGVVDKVKKS